MESTGKAVSIKKSMILLIVVLGLIVTGAFFFGYLVLDRYYQSVDERFVTEAERSVKTSATLFGNVLGFYQRTVDASAKGSRLADMLAFADTNEVTRWSRTLRGLLPSVLGAGLANDVGGIIGDPIQQRIGESCQHDLRLFQKQQLEYYPPAHVDANDSRLQHFDLLHTIRDDAGQSIGTLLVSFRLNELRRVMRQLLTKQDNLRLYDGLGRELVSLGEPLSQSFASFKHPIPGTSWQLQLDRIKPESFPVTSAIMLANLLTLLMITAMVYFGAKYLIGLMLSDVRRVHLALEDVLHGKFSLSNEPTLLKETEILLPEIEQVAHTLQVRQEQLRHETLTDELTGLFNRRYFELMLSHDFNQSLRQAPSFLAMIDVNDFKQVNDRHGHVAGDNLLTTVARLLADRVRATDTLVRLGGDEFAIILHNTSEPAMKSWYQQISVYFDEKMQDYVSEGKIPMAVSLSIGITIIDRKIHGSETELMHAADQAMYRAKARKQGSTIIEMPATP